eukprot:6487496-Amphidinium_carterae.2
MKLTSMKRSFDEKLQHMESKMDSRISKLEKQVKEKGFDQHAHASAAGPSPQAHASYHGARRDRSQGPRREACKGKGKGSGPKSTADPDRNVAVVAGFATKARRTVIVDARKQYVDKVNPLSGPTDAFCPDVRHHVGLLKFRTQKAMAALVVRTQSNPRTWPEESQPTRGVRAAINTLKGHLFKRRPEEDLDIQIGRRSGWECMWVGESEVLNGTHNGDFKVHAKALL